ncbi:AAA family ATPase [Bordetella sp. 15P40C-2]|uniref:AAA family ATPase n=1 Tax=Bordetella sp. 15P40C-2 TaxID=2572246 RepID=UPI001323A589|nr:AAA family ATPase [Bordetella sp. 15P40C-2]MVW73085.1 AAA family ATPase [Bordetella sp. 15P40C-2]
MRLHRIAIEEFRKFREPVVLDDLAEGLNVIAGPNEAGKSTFATAIRAAFLERYKTTKVADLAPWGSSGARPSVEIAFAHDGREYVLRKTFLSRARCELLIDGGAERHEGESAENALAGLLGFEFSAKGNSRPEHGGIPGLLWISQGEGQNLLDPVAHAQLHVREALTRLTGELSAVDGDSLFARVEAERGALRDGRSGRPKGAYKEAEDALARAEQLLLTLTADKQALDADVDRLAALRRDYDKAEQEQPWLALERRASEARARLAEIGREREALATLQRELAQANDTLSLLREQVERDQRDEAALKALRLEAEAAAAALAPTTERLERVLREQEVAAEQLARAQARVVAAQQVAQRQECATQIAFLDKHSTTAREAIAQAERLTEQVQALQAQATQVHIDDKVVRALRAVEQRLAQLHIQRNAGATRVVHRLAPGQALQLAGQERTGEGEVLISEPADIPIPGVGTLRIEPGGSDLPAILAAIEGAEIERNALLAQAGVESLAQAEARAAAYEQVLRDLDMARRALRVQAPDGVQSLRDDLEQTQDRLAQQRARLVSLPEDQADLDLPEAQRKLQAAQAEAEHLTRAVTSARTARDTQQAQAQLLQSQYEARQADFDAPARAEQRGQRGARLVQALATRDTLAHRCEAAQAALQALQPDLIEQDARRFEQSARLLRDEQQRRHGELLQLQGKLEQAQAHGVGERLAQAQAEAQRLTRRRDEFAARAQALDLLWQLLRERRDDATRRLLEPLSQRLRHYVGLLFPGAQWRLDDSLRPDALVRAAHADAAQPLDALSFGTREQLGVLARFAYADLLQQAGRPTLLVLDDTLVHADSQRRDLMKRALYDVASRHQVLLFTCHREAWQDMGVAIRDVPLVRSL